MYSLQTHMTSLNGRNVVLSLEHILDNLVCEETFLQM